MATRAPLTAGQSDAINNEAQLVRYMAHSGLTALRRAEFQQLGSYFEAFFAITISLERAAKLVLALDTRLTTGSFPTDSQLRDHGHNLIQLEEKVDSIVATRSLPVKWTKPSLSLDNEVLNFLDDFAAAGRDRYYNLNYLGAVQSGSTFDGPPAKWMSLISKHLTQAQLTLTRRERAGLAFHSMLDEDGAVIVRHAKEDGTPLNTMAASQEHFYLSERVQRVGTLACVQHLRFVMEALRCLGDESGETPDFWEYFTLLLNSDALLKNRKTFR